MCNNNFSVPQTTSCSREFSTLETQLTTLSVQREREFASKVQLRHYAWIHLFNPFLLWKTTPANHSKLMEMMHCYSLPGERKDSIKLTTILHVWRVKLVCVFLAAFIMSRDESFPSAVYRHLAKLFAKC